MSNHVKKRDKMRGGSRYETVPRNRKTRPKTFTTEESAKVWAKKMGITAFTLKDMTFENSPKKKIKVVITDA